jgi:RNA polymerase sigma-70 factor (ECF subfamily)
LPLQITPKLKVNKEKNEPLCKDIQFNNAAFETFFKNDFSTLCSYCQIKFGFDIEVAKEAVHTGFIKLWESRQSLSGNSPVKAYLHKIITNICLDILRHQKVKQKHEKYVLQNSSDASIYDSFDNPDVKSLATDINKAVSELPEQMRRVFELNRYEGLKYSEISSHLNISVKTVETQMSRALVKLRHQLSNYLPLYLTLFLFNF